VKFTEGYGMTPVWTVTGWRVISETKILKFLF